MLAPRSESPDADPVRDGERDAGVVWVAGHHDPPPVPGGGDASLFVTGRDVEEHDVGLVWDESGDDRRLDPKGDEAKLTTERRQVAAALRELGGFHRPVEVAAKLGRGLEATKKPHPDAGRRPGAVQGKGRGYAAPRPGRGQAGDTPGTGPKSPKLPRGCPACPCCPPYDLWCRMVPKAATVVVITAQNVSKSGVSRDTPTHIPCPSCPRPSVEGVRGQRGTLRDTQPHDSPTTSRLCVPRPRACLTRCSATTTSAETSPDATRPGMPGRTLTARGRDTRPVPDLDVGRRSAP